MYQEATKKPTALAGVKVKWAYIITVSLCAGFTTMSLGAALSAGVAKTNLKVVLSDFPKNEISYFSIDSAPVLGLAVGAFIGGIYGVKLGRRNSIILGNTALIIISVLSLIEIYNSILVLRFFFGVFAGFVLPQAPKIIVETVPANLIDYGFGAITNGFTFLMIALDEALSLLNQGKTN